MSKLFLIFLVILLTNACSKPSNGENEKIVIAHRGASGYLPEHSMASKAMAYAMGADYIEQDLVMTKDNEVIVLHDYYLNNTTNVAKIYPDRKRKDGKYYVTDFNLAEIKKLSTTQRFYLNKKGQQIANFPNRFPLWQSDFKIHTFAQEIELIQGLNKSTGKQIGIYPEIKAPWFFHQEGKDISKAVLNILKKYSYTNKNDLVYLQSFDPNELERIHQELLPEFGMSIKLVQVIAKTDWLETFFYQKDRWRAYNYDWMFEPDAMKKIAQYADVIAPSKAMIIKNSSVIFWLNYTNIVKDAHQAGMKVHAWTFHLDDGSIPRYASGFDNMLDIFYYQANVDGIFTDFTDRAVNFLQKYQ